MEEKHEDAHENIRHHESYEGPSDTEPGGKWNTEPERHGATSNTGPEHQVWSFKRPERIPHDAWQALGERKQTCQQQRP